VYDAIRDAVADLGLPLNRLERRRHRVEELFADEDFDELDGPGDGADPADRATELATEPAAKPAIPAAAAAISGPSTADPAAAREPAAAAEPATPAEAAEAAESETDHE